MRKFRILIVDDAVVFRRLVAEELARDPALEVVGTAANGAIGLARVTQVNPDLIILDIEMPEMDGLAMLVELRKTHPRLPVIMFSALTERGAAATLDALARGATDYFTKPTSAGGLDASLEVIRHELIPEIKALCEAASKAASSPARPSAAGLPAASPARPSAAGAPARPSAAGAPPPRAGAFPAAVEVVAIGASTGGPNALADVFNGLPAPFPVPIVIVQHMPPMFTRLLAERLSAQSGSRIEEGASGVALQPGRVWIAPGDHHMIVVRDGANVRMLIHQDPPENSCRPAVDVLFRSVAQTYGSRALAVVLTGMGADGLRGCEHIREAGGQIVAQDEATSVVWGMPGCVARAGLADRVVPLPLMASEIVRRVRAGATAGRGSKPG